jgi:hypothetical protein
VPPFPPPPPEGATAVIGRAAIPIHNVPPPRAVLATPVLPAPAAPAPPADDARGTVYRGGNEPGPSADPTGTSTEGSLTGFILSRGNADSPSSRLRLIVIAVVILVMIAVLGVIGLFAVRNVFEVLLGS